MNGSEAPTDDILDEAEALAAELARLAGAEIKANFGGAFAVGYKDASGERDPVSAIDSHVEEIVRARLSRAFPGHDVIGEESDFRPGHGHDWVWAIDPIDGTTNFVAGLPLFAATIGVLYKGEPVAGAVWCSLTHAFAPGVYSARRAGPLRYDGKAYNPTANPGVKRKTGGMPSLCDEGPLPFDVRKTGSAALECALAAAGLLEVCLFRPLNIWDVAGGLCLGRAAGLECWADTGEGFRRFERFSAMSRSGEPADLRSWRGAVCIGKKEAAAAAKATL